MSCFRYVLNKVFARVNHIELPARITFLLDRVHIFLWICVCLGAGRGEVALPADQHKPNILEKSPTYSTMP